MRIPGVLLVAAGMLATGIVFGFLVEFGDDLSTRFGIYLGLVGSLAISVGGVMASSAPAAAAPGTAAAAPAPTGGQQSPAPGWYPDPEGGGQRYWDRASWTEHRA